MNSTHSRQDLQAAAPQHLTLCNRATLLDGPSKQLMRSSRIASLSG
jgi:hypothetical protein